jgi:hypothetical protein
MSSISGHIGANFSDARESPLAIESGSAANFGSILPQFSHIQAIARSFSRRALAGTMIA